MHSCVSSEGAIYPMRMFAAEAGLVIRCDASWAGVRIHCVVDGQALRKPITSPGLS